MYEGYFDESYREDESPETFVVAGYFLAGDSARAMEEEWSAMVTEHGLPYFHMADVAHGRKTCENKKKAERIDIQTKAIALIKKHTLYGYAAVALEDSYAGFAEGEALYPRFANMAVTGLEQFLRIARVEGDVAYVFEAGHADEKSASVRIGERLRKSGDSVTFGGKEAFVVLQAADLLAWHSRKYVQDKKTGERAPRDDFLSLMEHRHTFCHILTGDEGQDFLGVQAWPLTDRAPFTAELSFDHDGPITIMREGDSDVPIIPVEIPVGWKMGAGQMAYAMFKSLGGEDFALAFDEPRLREAVYFLAIVMEKIWDRVPLLTMEAIEVVDRTDDHVVLGVEAAGGDVRLAIEVPKTVFERLIEEERE